MGRLIIIEPISWDVKQPEQTGIFHDTRADVRTIREAIRRLIFKNNDMIKAINCAYEEVEELKKRVQELENKK